MRSPPCGEQGIQAIRVGSFLEEGRFRHGRCFPKRDNEQRHGEEDSGGWGVAGQEGRTMG